MHTPDSPHEVHAATATTWTTQHPGDLLGRVYLESERAVLGGADSGANGTRRPTRWIQTLHRYEQFWRDHGRAPRENTRDRNQLPTTERNLGQWARYQRRFSHRLTPFQTVRLDASPAFAWDPHEHAWSARMSECERHLAVHGRLPFLNSADSQELHLARWLGRQLRHLQTGALPAGRAARLIRLLAAAQADLG